MSKGNRPPCGLASPSRSAAVILHEPTQVLAGQRPVGDDADVARPVADFPRLADRHARRQRLVVKALQLAPAPDALLEDGPEGEGIEHSDLDSEPADSPVSQPAVVSAAAGCFSLKCPKARNLA